MSLTSGLQIEGLKYAKAILDTVRRMSADTLGVTRQGYSELETDVLHYLQGLGRDLDLEIHSDDAGNVWMTLPGRDRSLPALVSGSHVDSVPQGGNYDGLAGVTAALTVAWWMRRHQFQPERDYTVLMMRCEESSFFGKAYVGSLGMMGRLTTADLLLRHRTQDITLGQSISSCGLDANALTTGKPVIDLEKFGSFIELHIEQGPTLTSNEKVRVGVVTGIRGNVRHKNVVCHGETAHSGAVNKEFRHDAVMATAALIHRLENAWQEWLDKGEDLVFTVGVIRTGATAAISVIPGEVSFTVDMRSLSADTCERFHTLMLEEAAKIEKERGVRFDFDKALYTAPGAVDQALSDRLYAAAEANHIPCMRLPSGAGHDAAVIGAAGVPVAMIFVANQNGSHNPHEEMQMKDFMTGVDLLWQTVRTFD
ncbi:MAG: hydantoinase/carbamoylase family amidase [Sutterella wadsworthensis]|nr:hydantoinase/carbamoylase family amidase [Sutterella wadsworthensis]